MKWIAFIAFFSAFGYAASALADIYPDGRTVIKYGYFTVLALASIYVLVYGSVTRNNLRQFALGIIKLLLWIGVLAGGGWLYFVLLDIFPDSADLLQDVFGSLVFAVMVFAVYRVVRRMRESDLSTVVEVDEPHITDAFGNGIPGIYTIPGGIDTFSETQYGSSDDSGLYGDDDNFGR